MSDAAPPPQPMLPHPPEQERLAFGRVIAVGVAAMVVFAGAVYWAGSILRSETGALRRDGEAPVPPRVGQAEIGIVDQRLFELEGRAERLRREQLRRLTSYGWVDRDAGVIHVPITQAMDEVVQELSKGGMP